MLGNQRRVLNPLVPEEKVVFGVVANVKMCDTISRMATEYCSVDIKGVQVVWFCVLGSITHYTILIHACMCVLGSLTHYTILIHACMCV